MKQSEAKKANLYKESISSKLKNKSLKTSTIVSGNFENDDEDWLEEYYLRRYGPCY